MPGFPHTGDKAPVIFPFLEENERVIEEFTAVLCLKAFPSPSSLGSLLLYNRYKGIDLCSQKSFSANHSAEEMSSHIQLACGIVMHYTHTVVLCIVLHFH